MGVECTGQRLTAGVSLLLISQALVENVMETIFASYHATSKAEAMSTSQKQEVCSAA